MKITMEINKESCNKTIYKYGEFVGLSEMSRKEADAHCQKLSDTTKDEYFYDWHFISGRVRILRLHKDSPHFTSEV